MQNTKLLFSFVRRVDCVLHLRELCRVEVSLWHYNTAVCIVFPNKSTQYHIGFFVGQSPWIPKNDSLAPVLDELRV